MKQRREGFRKPVNRTSKRVGLAAVKDDPAGVITCSCGWEYVHVRDKVRADAGQRHITKSHHGRGIWL